MDECYAGSMGASRIGRYPVTKKEKPSKYWEMVFAIQIPRFAVVQKSKAGRISKPTRKPVQGSNLAAGVGLGLRGEHWTCWTC